MSGTRMALVKRDSKGLHVVANGLKFRPDPPTDETWVGYGVRVHVKWRTATPIALLTRSDGVSRFWHSDGPSDEVARVLAKRGAP